MKAPSATIKVWRGHTDIFTNHQLINELITKVFVEQPLASPGSANNLRHTRAWIIFLMRICHITTNIRLTMETTTATKVPLP